MARSAQQIEVSMRRMRGIGSAFRIVFGVAIGATVAVAIFVLCKAVSAIAEGGVADSSGSVYFGSDGLINVGYLMFWFITCLLVEIALFNIALDMAHGVSPFTKAHAVRIAVIGAIFVAKSLIVPALFNGMVNFSWGPFTLFDSSYSMRLVLPALGLQIDLSSLFIGMICLVASTVWLYGSLLQEQTEDLV